MNALDISYSGENVDPTLFLPLQRQFLDEGERRDELTEKMKCLDVNLSLNDSIPIVDVTQSIKTVKSTKSYVSFEYSSARNSTLTFF